MLYCLVVVVMLFCGAFYMFQRRISLKGNIIPGPKGLPVIGFALEINEANLCSKLTEYAETFGDIFQFRIFSDNLIVLNSPATIHKAFVDEKFKRHFNDRPKMFYGEYFRCHHQTIGSVPEGFGMFHKTSRKHFVKAVHAYGSGLMDLEKNVMSEMDLLANRIEEMPDMTFQCMDVFSRSFSNVISLLFSGELIHDDEPDRDIFLQHTEGSIFFLNSAVNSVMTSLPFLRFLPGKFREMYMKTETANDRIKQKYFHDMKNTYVPGKHRGIVDFYIEEQSKERESGSDVFFTDERIMVQIEEIVDAGITTSSIFLSNSILVLMNYPEIQNKIQAEIDTVIGKERHPTYSDRNNCHYLQAFEMEIHRYLTITPFLLPHLCQDHIEFLGYDIEPNSLILANVWYVHHDKGVWGDPWTFRPERFLNDEGQLLPREHKLRKSLLPFGCGQRQCTGETLAKTRIFLYLATLLQRWSFEFPKGSEMSCDPRTPGSFDMVGIIKPMPFSCKAKERYKQ
ncbi:steroid 17-alpha-hydroxylase/17,20 lyase-like isoform X1 [Mercenaria mercenaria]|uniref:steroid 17-alpha-hydroxylase/17,20 lyase-like isoform X1 n=1 Tax=Mercenaria mercenaria TaxID=6596 RepID=UPI00234E730A|nr:steroid 17-alpha-hydroxylase/17,20 lyase-like isoform X1 [Mercenaria mercenaria]